MKRLERRRSSYRYATFIQRVEEERLPIAINVMVLATEILDECQDQFFAFGVRSIRFRVILRILADDDRPVDEREMRVERTQ